MIQLFYFWSWEFCAILITYICVPYDCFDSLTVTFSLFHLVCSKLNQFTQKGSIHFNKLLSKLWNLKYSVERRYTRASKLSKYLMICSYDWDLRQTISQQCCRYLLGFFASFETGCIAFISTIGTPSTLSSAALNIFKVILCLNVYLFWNFPSSTLYSILHDYLIE